MKFAYKILENDGFKELLINIINQIKHNKKIAEKQKTIYTYFNSIKTKLC